ncbi:MAG: hypothetical protein ACE5OQ_10600 [Woeseia sp.]
MSESTIARIIILLCVCAGSAPRIFAQSSEITSTGDPAAPEFRVMGFGDIGYISRDGTDKDGFIIGQAVTHLAAALGDSLSVFGEFSATGKDSQYSFEVERLIVKYEFSDTLKLSAGRYHTPIGYWNSAFHHGAWLQTSTTRPEMVKFGSKLVPIHFVGMLLEGSIAVGNIGLAYKAGYGNGRHSNIARAGDAGDVNGDKAWMLQIVSRPRNIYGLDLGLGFYSDEVELALAPDVKESTFSGHVAWTKESPEIILEYLHSEHELLVDSSVSGDVDAWYAQFAYRLKGEHAVWKPYVRFEHQEIDDTDPLLSVEGLNHEASILGVRWDFNPYAALKAEYRNEEFNNGGREDNFQVQLSFVLAKL